MSVYVAEKKGSALKSSNGLITTMENEDGDWQNGQNLLLVTQDVQSKELINLTDNQTINVAVDTYCTLLGYRFFCQGFWQRKEGRGQLVEPKSMNANRI